MNCNRCGKWAGAHATLPGQSRDHLCMCSPQRKPLTDEQKYALIKKHLGLNQRRNETVIDPYTGLFWDAARYFNLIDAAIEAFLDNTTEDDA